LHGCRIDIYTILSLYDFNVWRTCPAALELLFRLPNIIHAFPRISDPPNVLLIS